MIRRKAKRLQRNQRSKMKRKIVFGEKKNGHSLVAESILPPKKINKNCFLKTHLLKHGICSMKCCFDHFSKKHHTLLHFKSPHQASLNPTNKQDFTHF